MALDHRAHSAVQNEDAPFEELTDWACCHDRTTFEQDELWRDVIVTGEASVWMEADTGREPIG
jgi:hypothetical protein